VKIDIYDGLAGTISAPRPDKPPKAKDPQSNKPIKKAPKGGTT
jgi:hypothetical protein